MPGKQLQQECTLRVVYIFQAVTLVAELSKREITGESFVIISFVDVLIRLGGLPPNSPTRPIIGLR